jgi:AcrR family transcriptional regulator
MQHAGVNFGMRRKRGINFTEADSRQLEKIRKIAKIAAQIFSSKGFLATSLDDIAAGAKLTKGGVYHYFNSKDEILYFICSTYVDMDLEGLEQSLAQLSESREKIKFIIDHHIEHYSVHSYAAKTLLHESYNLRPKYLKEIRARERRYFEIVSKAIFDFLGGKATKELVTTLSFTLFGMMNWIYKWYDPKGGIKPKELSQIIYEIFVAGMEYSALVREQYDDNRAGSATRLHSMRNAIYKEN